MRRYFLYIFLLIFVVGILVWAGFFNLNKIESFFANFNIFTAMVSPEKPLFEDSELDLSEISKICVETYPVAIRIAGITDVTTA